MAQFSVNPARFDPYKNFKFRVKWDGRYIAGVSKVSALKRLMEAEPAGGATELNHAIESTEVLEYFPNP